MIGFGPIADQPVAAIPDGVAAVAGTPFTTQTVFSSIARPAMAVVFAVANLLAGGPLGTVQQDPAASQQTASTPHRLAVNADTSRGTPKVLYGDATFPTKNLQHTAPDRVRPVADTSRGSLLTLAPAGPSPFAIPQVFAPDRVRPVVDTSKGTAKVLYGDATFPTKNLQHTAPDRVRPVTDTSRGSLLTLAPAGPSPFAIPQVFAPDRVRPVVDTSKGTAKVLYGDATFPTKNLQHTAPDRVRPVTDTSRGSLLTLAPAGPSPFAIPQVFAPDRVRPVVDTSLGYLPPPPPVVVQDPFTTPQVFAPDRVRPVVDTSRGTAKVLYGDAALPARNLPHTAPDRVRPVADASRGFLPPAVVVAQDPFTVPQVFTLDRVRPVVDTSQGVSPGTLLAPFVNLPQATPDRVRPVADASRGFLPPPVVVIQDPFSVAQVFAPDRFREIYADATRATPKVLYADAVVPFQNLQHTAPDRVRPTLVEVSHKTNINLDVPPYVEPPVVEPPRKGGRAKLQLINDVRFEIPGAEIGTGFGTMGATLVNPPVFVPPVLAPAAPFVAPSVEQIAPTVNVRAEVPVVEARLRGTGAASVAACGARARVRPPAATPLAAGVVDTVCISATPAVAPAAPLALYAGEFDDAFAGVEHPDNTAEILLAVIAALLDGNKK